MPMTRAERERVHEVRKEQEKAREVPHKSGHSSRGGF